MHDDYKHILTQTSITDKPHVTVDQDTGHVLYHKSPGLIKLKARKDICVPAAEIDLVDIPLYFGELHHDHHGHYNYLAKVVSNIGAYLKQPPLDDEATSADKERRQIKLLRCHLAQRRLMALKPLVKLERYGKCTVSELRKTLVELGNKIDRELFIGDYDDQPDNIHHSLDKSLRIHLHAHIEKITREQVNGKGDSDEIDLRSVDLYSPCQEMVEAILDHLQRESTILGREREGLSSGDRLYTFIQDSKAFVRDPANPRLSPSMPFEEGHFGQFSQCGDSDTPLNLSYLGVRNACIVDHIDSLNKSGLLEGEAISLTIPADSTALPAYHQTNAEKLMSLRQGEHIPNPERSSEDAHGDDQHDSVDDSFFYKVAAGAALGFTAGTVVPGLGNAVGAIVGACAGAVSSVVSLNIKWEGKKWGLLSVPTGWDPKVKPLYIPKYLGKSVVHALGPVIDPIQQAWKERNSPKRFSRALVVETLPLEGERDKATLYLMEQKDGSIHCYKSPDWVAKKIEAGKKPLLQAAFDDKFYVDEATDPAALEEVILLCGYTNPTNKALITLEFLAANQGAEDKEGKSKESGKRPIMPAQPLRVDDGDGFSSFPFAVNEV